MIDGTATNGTGVLLHGGGVVSNQSGGTIKSAYIGLHFSQHPATLVNAGVVSGNSATAAGSGVSMSAGGAVTNQAGGTITGSDGIYASGTACVVNAGSIGGKSAGCAGVSLGSGGAVTNQSGGIISGGNDAVQFSAGITDALVDRPGRGVHRHRRRRQQIGSASISTLELASGASAGTLSGLGTQFIDFAQVTIDSGAQWVFGGYNTIASGATLTNSGTDTVTGTLVNAGVFTGDQLQLDNGVFTNQVGGLVTASYVYGIAGGTGSVVNQGTINNAAGFAIDLEGAGNVSNAAGALISSYDGVKLTGDEATLVNLGAVSASGHATGAYLRNGGVIINGRRPDRPPARRRSRAITASCLNRSTPPISSAQC